MRQIRQTSFEIPVERSGAPLDLVVPFTTPELTALAIDAANRMGAGLNAQIRLFSVKVVPFPLDLAQSPVPLEFLRQQLRSFRSDLPVQCEVRLTREFVSGLQDVLNRHSLVVLATPKRPWHTRTERIAASLRRAGYTVVLVRGGK